MFRKTTIASPLGFAASPIAWLGTTAAKVLYRLVQWQERAEQRHHLEGMDDRMLKDIGVNRIDANQEANKPFWRA